MEHQLTQTMRAFQMPSQRKEFKLAWARHFTQSGTLQISGAQWAVVFHRFLENKVEAILQRGHRATASNSAALTTYAGLSCKRATASSMNARTRRGWVRLP